MTDNMGREDGDWDKKLNRSVFSLGDDTWDREGGCSHSLVSCQKGIIL